MVILLERSPTSIARIPQNKKLERLSAVKRTPRMNIVDVVRLARCVRKSDQNILIIYQLQCNYRKVLGKVATRSCGTRYINLSFLRARL